MIFKENFKIGSHNVEISTVTALSKNLVEEITFLIEFFSKELNHNITESSAWKFNNGQTRIPIYVKPEFIQYFKFVYKIFSRYPDTFEPYSIPYLKIEQITIDESQNYILKNIDFKFDTSFFRVIFIIEYISAYLKEKKILSYLIESEDKYISWGNTGWEINPNGHKFNLVNKAAFFFHYQPSGFESHKFGAILNELSETDALAIGSTLAELRVLTPQISYLNTKTDLTKFAYENEIEVRFLD